MVKVRLNWLEKIVYAVILKASINVCESWSNRLKVSLLELVVNIPEVKNEKIALRVIFSLRMKGLINPLAESRLACQMIELPLSFQVDYSNPRLYEIIELEEEKIVSRKEAIERRKNEEEAIKGWVREREYFFLDDVPAKMPKHQLIRFLIRIGCEKNISEDNVERWFFSSERASMAQNRTLESVAAVENVLAGLAGSYSIKELLDLSSVNWSVDIMRVFIVERGWVKDNSQRHKWKPADDKGIEMIESCQAQDEEGSNSPLDERIFELNRRACDLRIQAEQLRLQASNCEEEAALYEGLADDLKSEFEILQIRLREVDAILSKK